MLDRIFPAATFTGANTFNVTLHLEIPAEKFQTLDQILTLCQSNQQELQAMSSEVQAVLDATTVIKDRDAALITLVNGLGDKIKQNIDDKAALLGIATDLTAEAAAVKTAIDANTTETVQPKGEPA